MPCEACASLPDAVEIGPEPLPPAASQLSTIGAIPDGVLLRCPTCPTFFLLRPHATPRNRTPTRSALNRLTASAALGELARGLTARSSSEATLWDAAASLLETNPVCAHRTAETLQGLSAQSKLPEGRRCGSLLGRSVVAPPLVAFRGEARTALSHEAAWNVMAELVHVLAPGLALPRPQLPAPKLEDEEVQASAYIEGLRVSCVEKFAATGRLDTTFGVSGFPSDAQLAIRVEHLGARRATVLTGEAAATEAHTLTERFAHLTASTE